METWTGTSFSKKMKDLPETPYKIKINHEYKELGNSWSRLMPMVKQGVIRH
jgi:hypothetical protein